MKPCGHCLVTSAAAKGCENLRQEQKALRLGNNEVSVPKSLYTKNSEKLEGKEPVTTGKNQWQQPRDKRSPELQSAMTASAGVPRSPLHLLALGTPFPILNTWTP